MPSSACDWSSDVCSSDRSEEHTSELQSRSDLVCRLLLEKKKTHVSIPVTVGARMRSSAARRSSGAAVRRASLGIVFTCFHKWGVCPCCRRGNQQGERGPG